MTKLDYNANLCRACQNIFDEKSIPIPELESDAGVYGLPRLYQTTWFFHNDGISPLEYVQSSARDGCRICALIAPQFAPGGKSAEKMIYAMAYKTDYDESVRRYIPWFEIHFHYFVPGCEAQLSCSYAIREDMEIESFLPELVDSTQSSTESTASFNIASKWLANCLKDHPRCRQWQSTDWYPTRLLHFSSDPSSKVIRLIEARENAPVGPYIALSHRWGSKPFIQLTTKSHDDMKTGIPLSSLPKSFSEAIQVAQRLSINYIWIDSLCIIQDSPSDWQHEASLMGLVYQNAHFTLSASGANDSSEGLFFTHPSSSILPCRVPTLRLREFTEFGFERRSNAYIIEHNLWRDMFVESPLNDRGWVLQERVLSPRMLHFGRRQLAWECLELEACEAFPTGLPPSLPTDQFKKIDQPFFHRAPEEDENMAYQHAYTWQQWVKDYTRRNLTFSSDKEVAIAGIAAFHGNIRGDTLVCGLWKKTLMRELLWTMEFAPNKMFIISADGKKPASYRAPSWSWLALDGVVSTYAMRYGGGKLVAEVENMHIARQSTDLDDENNLAPILGGYLKLRAVPKKCTWALERDNEERIDVFIGDDVVHELTATADTAAHAPSSTGIASPREPIICILVEIFTHDKEHLRTGRGLILKQTQTGDAETVEYKRVGHFWLNTWDYLAFFLDPRESFPEGWYEWSRKEKEDFKFDFGGGRVETYENPKAFVRGVEIGELETVVLKIV